jgi:hypothetical protein
MNKNIAVVIVSCDKYSDLWNPILSSIKKFWPDCPYTIYFVSNELSPKFNGVTNIPVGPDISWSSNLKKALGQIPEEFVFMWLDDLFPTKPVNTKKVSRLFEWAINKDINYLCLKGLPRADKKVTESIGLVSEGSLYRVSTVLSFWKKHTLFDLLKEKENAWQFEIEGSIRSDAYPDFYVTLKPEIFVVNAVIKGKWRRKALAKIKRNISFEVEREVNSLVEELVFDIKRWRSFIFNLFPNKLRRKIRVIFK